jgi:hypothetical protein
MSDRPSHNLKGLDIDLSLLHRGRLPLVRGHLAGGGRPRAEDYLAEIPAKGRAALRAELEALERELRRAEEMVALPEARAATSPESLLAPFLSTVAEAPTLAPGTLPFPRIPPGRSRYDLWARGFFS